MDCDGDPETVVPRSALLDNVMLYWLPATGASSARLYWESIADVNAVLAGETLDPIDVPTACSIFPGELQRSSRRWAQRRFRNIHHWGEPPRGGHFAAFEQTGRCFAAETPSRVPRCVDREPYGHGAVGARAGQPGRLERQGERMTRAGRAPVGDATRSPGASGTCRRREVGALPDVARPGRGRARVRNGVRVGVAGPARRAAGRHRRLREPARDRPGDAGRARARVPAASRQRGGRAAARRLRGLRDQRVRREPVVRPGRVARRGGAAAAARRRPRVPHELAAGHVVRARRGRGDATACCATSAG